MTESNRGEPMTRPALLEGLRKLLNGTCEEFQSEPTGEHCHRCNYIEHCHDEDAILLAAIEALAAPAETSEEKVAHAKQLLIEATQETRAQRHAETKAEPCQCGHSRDEHTISASINYTGGFCMADGCKCQWFMLGDLHAEAR